MHAASARFPELLDAIKAASRPLGSPTKVVGIDGPGGAGKSTLARDLAAAIGEVPVVQTDDFASRDNPDDWWLRLLEQVLRPLAAGEEARYQRYDWNHQSLAEWIVLPLRPEVVILEGVTAIRREFDPYLAYRIWVETPRTLRLHRGLERDGESMRRQWESWMAAEDAYLARDNPIARADTVVSGQQARRRHTWTGGDD
jgi:uridine kinase